MRPLRDIVVPLVLVVGAVLLGAQVVVALFVVFGYSHFLLGYLYRVRARKESLGYLVVVPSAALVLSALYFMYIGAVLPVFIITAFIFATHFSVDEYFLHSDALAGARWLILGAFLGIDFVLSVGLVVPAVMLYAELVALLLLIAIGVRLLMVGVNVSATEQYLAFVGALLFLMAVFGNAQLMLGVIVLLHCYNWYDWGYGRAVQKRGVPAYVRDVALTLGVFMVLFGLSLSGVVPSLGQYFAESSYYYYYFPLALAHIATSIRFG